MKKPLCLDCNLAAIATDMPMPALLASPSCGPDLRVHGGLEDTDSKDTFSKENGFSEECWMSAWAAAAPV